MSKHAIAAAVAVLLPLAAQASNHQPGAAATHSGHGAAEHAMPAASAADDAVADYRAAADRMHMAMDIPFTGDPDADFARGMIAHHEGAIEMARILLEHGEDPELRALAEDIIAAQEREVAILQDWLARNAQ